MQPPRILNITSVAPLSGVPGGILRIDCRGFKPELSSRVLFGDVEAPIISASDSRIFVRLPESPKSLGLTLKVKRTQSAVFPFSLGTKLASDLHPVANPVVAPDGSVITTISGSRGQQVHQPLIRITRAGDRIPFNCEILNPTGLAFSKDGQLYISSRSDGTVVRYTDYDRLDVIAEDLGTPCGLAFDSNGLLYVGDRTGRIYRIDGDGNKEEFAQLEPSVSAYHLAIDAEDRLYVTGPTFSVRDSLTRFTPNGEPERLIDGLARPQGMAFLPNGDLLMTAGYEGKKGVFQYSVKDGTLQHLVAAPILVGLAVSGRDLYFATGDSVYLGSLPGIAPVN